MPAAAAAAAAAAPAAAAAADIDAMYVIEHVGGDYFRGRDDRQHLDLIIAVRGAEARIPQSTAVRCENGFVFLFFGAKQAGYGGVFAVK